MSVGIDKFIVKFVDYIQEKKNYLEPEFNDYGADIKKLIDHSTCMKFRVEHGRERLYISFSVSSKYAHDTEEKIKNNPPNNFAFNQKKASNDVTTYIFEYKGNVYSDVDNTQVFDDIFDFMEYAVDKYI